MSELRWRTIPPLVLSFLRIRFLPLLDPFRGLFGFSFSGFTVLQQVLHAMRRRHVPAFLHPGPLQHSVFPGFQVRELVDIDPCPARGCNPPPMRDVGDRAPVADEVPGR